MSAIPKVLFSFESGTEFDFAVPLILNDTPEKTNEIVNYIAFAFVYGYNENEMTVDNAEVNISPLIQSSEDSKNETSEKEAVLLPFAS